MRLVTMLCVTAAVAACNQPHMADQPRVDTYETPESMPDRLAARAVPTGTVARDDDIDPHAVPLTRMLLQRGRERYDIYCAPCHGRNGYGQGVIVQRGMPAPPSYHTPRLRQADDEHYYRVISDGYGAMYSYASRLAPGDRRAVIAWIRVLQLSQDARAADLPASVVPQPEDNALPVARP